MQRLDRSRDADDDQDLIDALPFVGRATSQLEQSLGPSCLLSLVIILLLAIVLKRFLRLSWVGLGGVSLVVWFVVMTLLIRWRPRRLEADDE